MGRVGGAIAVALVGAGLSAAAPKAGPGVEAPGGAQKSEYHQRVENGWASAFAAQHAPGACIKKIGRRGARALATWRAELSVSSAPHCSPWQTCGDLIGTIWGECADTKWDAMVSPQASPDPKRLPCAKIIRRESDWEGLAYRGFYGE